MWLKVEVWVCISGQLGADACRTDQPALLQSLCKVAMEAKAIPRKVDEVLEVLKKD